MYIIMYYYVNYYVYILLLCINLYYKIKTLKLYIIR